MADPKYLDEFDDGRLGPEAIDAVPSDWQEVRYQVIVDAHPDLPSVPILRFVPVGLTTEALALMVETEPSGGTGAAREDDGDLIYALPE